MCGGPSSRQFRNHGPIVGRWSPTAEGRVKSWVGLMPNAVKIVANQSGTFITITVNLRSRPVRLADGRLCCESTSSDNGRRDAREVVAAALGINPRRAAEHAHPQDDRLVRQARGFQIRQERCPRLVYGFVQLTDFGEAVGVCPGRHAGLPRNGHSFPRVTEPTGSLGRTCNRYVGRTVVQLVPTGWGSIRSQLRVAAWVQNRRPCCVTACFWLLVAGRTGTPSYGGRQIK